jgi:two-component system, cell cycle sensor histidine kinase and response regulator CckA
VTRPRVLIVDDHEANLYLLRSLLEGHGCVVESARHGADALDCARRQAPDLIISDLLMPVLDGYTLLRHWRSDARLKDIPFIVYTATYTEPRDERLAMAFGADAFVVKPCEPEQLVAKVLEVLELHGRGALPSAAPRPVDAPVLISDYNEVLIRKLEQKALEAEESEQRFRETFEQIAVGLAHVDTEGRFVWVNAKLCEMTGYDRDDLAARTYLDITDAGDRDAGDAARREMLAGERALYSAEKRYRRKDGSCFWGNIHTTLARNAAGDVLYFVSVILDITERKRLEDQLRQAQKMEAVGRLAGGVAHDFNNLLTIISGYSDLLLNVPLAQPDREAVSAIRDAGERAAALTRQLLSFSRQTIVQPKALDLNAVVDDTGRMLRRLIGADVQLTIRPGADLRAVKADPSQLDQVIVNLAVNARDAMPSGGALTIETANVVLSDAFAAANLCQPGPHVMLAMTDTGCGMPPDVRARIFEPFFTTKEVSKGTGLGLSMVFGVLQQSHGCVEVDSQPGRGTTFRLYLPAVDERPEAGVEMVREDPGGGETILLVEDEGGVRELAARSLRSRGYNVLAATDGVDALRTIDGTGVRLDLVLTDVVMPRLGGPELVSALRARYPGLKVLFMSGYTDDAMVRRGIRDAGAAFLQKPYTPHGLAQKVRDALDQ